jgi:hypothetical protein
MKLSDHNKIMFLPPPKKDHVPNRTLYIRHFKKFLKNLEKSLYALGEF